MIQTEMEYTGPIEALQGKKADVRSLSTQETDNYRFAMKQRTARYVMAQFQGTGSWLFMRFQDFTPITGKPVF